MMRWRQPVSNVAVTRLCLALMVLMQSQPLACAKRVHAPPSIESQPEVEMSFKDREKVELPCVAKGDPAPTYNWKKDDQPLAISGIDIRQLPGIGTIVIEDPMAAEHEGIYQCFASNEFGTTISIKTILKKAVQEPFPTVKEPKIHRPTVGMSLTLRCQPPYGYPKGVVYWGEYKSGSKLKPIENDNRVSLDYDGNLHFSNVMSADDRKGLHYVCIVQNMELRSLMQGDDQKIESIGSGSNPPYQPPRLMWGSQSQVAIKGQSHKLKCIFSGFPTPRVTWTKIGSQLLVNDRVQITSYGQEISFDSVEYTDEGTYECSAVNTDSGQTRSTHRIQLTVESPPYWKDDRPPEDVNTSEEESAQFNCEVEGKPKPVITWLINGVPISSLPPNRRRIVANNYVRYENVTKTDAQVLQCNASNKHGYIFSNSYLNVLAEPPSFIETPKSVTKVSEGQTAVLTCQVFGAPKPTITWKKENEPLIADPRFKKESSGNLIITDIRTDDAGQYQCYTINKFGNEEANGKLIVREKTVITDPPKNTTATIGSDVTLHCNATTDVSERRNLEIIWMRYGFPIDYQSENNIAMYTVDRSLKINHARIDNTGSYTCNATNGLDWDAVTAQLTVRGRPDPPYDVRIVSCGTQQAEISWIAGSDNNDPVLDFIVYYNTSFDKPDQYTDGARVSAKKYSSRVRVEPWTNYTFHVVARNSLGQSDRSPFTQAVCTTPQQRPYKNPRGVCTESREPDQLVIVWEAMPPTDHNGEDFHYIVSYKRFDGEEEVKQKVMDVRTTGDSTLREYVVKGQEMYQEYEIAVQAGNQEGLAPAQTVERRIGYSGQGVPLDQPVNFRLNDSSLDSTSAEFLWEPVDESVERVQGFFKGYQIIFWKTGNQSTERTEDVILHSWESCRASPPKRRRRNAKQPVKGRTSQLWPYSSITAAVRVVNAGGKPGPLSPTIEFRTLEGVPTPVRNFGIMERGSHHLKVSWNLPAEYNGNPTGYVIVYKKAPPAMGPPGTLPINNILQTSAKLVDLEPDTLYLIYIRATTDAGNGEETFAEERTNILADPSPPAISGWDTGDNSVNLTWTPTAYDPANSADNNNNNNPGHKFTVEYRKAESGDDWKSVGPEKEHNWLNVSGLESGTEYEFRVVAMNNGDNTTASRPTVIYVGPIRPDPIESSRASGPGWLVLLILLCILLLLLIVLCIICVVWRNRGGKYAVHEKERLRGHDSNKDEDDVGFGEYTRTPRTELKYSEEPHKKSQASLNSDEKPLDGDSETDSLGEYEDPDPSKFNEDGSFIGQYGGKKKSTERIDQQLLQHQADGTTPSALSTFV